MTMDYEAVRQALIDLRFGAGLADTVGLSNQTQLLEHLGKAGDLNGGRTLLLEIISRIPEPVRELLEMQFNTELERKNLSERRTAMMKKSFTYRSSSTLARAEEPALKQLAEAIVQHTSTPARVVEQADSDYPRSEFVQYPERSDAYSLHVHRSRSSGLGFIKHGKRDPLQFIARRPELGDGFDIHGGSTYLRIEMYLSGHLRGVFSLNKSNANSVEFMQINKVAEDLVILCGIPPIRSAHDVQPAPQSMSLEGGLWAEFCSAETGFGEELY